MGEMERGHHTSAPHEISATTVAPQAGITAAVDDPTQPHTENLAQLTQITGTYEVHSVGNAIPLNNIRQGASGVQVTEIIQGNESIKQGQSSESLERAETLHDATSDEYKRIS